MKSQYLIISFFLTISLIQAQDKFCYEAPSLDFGGTQIAYSYMVHDSTLSPTACQGIVYDKNRGNMWIAPLEYDDMYIINMGTASGSMTWALDKENNEVLWRQQTNHLDNSDERFFSTGFVNKVGNDSLELITYRGHWPWPTTPITASRSGYPGRRIMNRNTGEVLSDYWVQDTLQDNLNLVYFTGLGANSFPQLIDGTDIYYTYGLFESNSDTMTHQWSHTYIDRKTLLRYRHFPPFDELAGLGMPAQDIRFNYRGTNGLRPLGGYATFGPVELDENENMYFLRYRLDDTVHTHRIVVDDWGNLIGDNDITENIDKGTNNFYWQPSLVKLLNNGNIRFYGGAIDDPTFWNFGQQGFVEIDKVGNRMKDCKSLTIDGLRPFMMASTELFKRRSHLHVFRPIENNNLYIYEEVEGGAFNKLGELLNTNIDLFAFAPRNVWISDKNDVFINAEVLLDSMWGTNNENNFNLGGWQCLIKISGQELGITTGTNVITSREILKVYPNPTTNELFIKSEMDLGKIDVLIINRLGQEIHQQKDFNSNSNLTLQNIPSDMYFLIIKNSTTKEIIYKQPILKIE